MTGDNQTNQSPEAVPNGIPPLGVASIVIQFLIIIVSVVCNALVIITIIGYRRLHNYTNYLVVNQCVIDFLFATLIILPYPIQALLGYWPFIKEWCTMHYCLGIGLVMVSILNLCAISCDRYLAICHPFQHPQLVTKKSLIIILLFVWIQPLLICFLPLMLWRKSQDLYQGYCANDIDRSLIQERAFFAAFLTINYVFPAIIMLTLYCLIFRVAHKQVHRIEKQHHPASPSMMDTSRVKKAKDKDLKLVFLFFAIVGTLYICWTPLYTTMLISFFDVYYQSHIGLFIVIILAFSNCALNPVIYSCSNAHIRQGLFHLLGLKVAMHSDRYVTTV